MTREPAGARSASGDPRAPVPAPTPDQAIQALLEATGSGPGEWAPGEWGSLRLLEAQQLPQPWRGLLAHPRDMTRTLERHHGVALRLETLERRLATPRLYRRVLLVDAGPARRIVEVGAIRIELDALPGEACERVLAAREPLGGILHACGLAHEGRPRAYFACRPGPALARLLDIDPERGDRAPDAELYGRLSRLHRRDDGRLLAEAVEILPPPGPSS